MHTSRNWRTSLVIFMMVFGSLTGCLAKPVSPSTGMPFPSTNVPEAMTGLPTLPSFALEQTVQPVRTPLLQNTPTDIPPNVRTWGDYPGPTIWPPIEIPPPLGVLPRPEGQINILLLGDDQRPNEQSFRTDSIMLLTINSIQGTISLTSFPRDLYIFVPGWTMQRINVVFQRGGFDLMALAFEYNFGVRPDYFAKINAWALQNLVDSLGGIEVTAAYAMTDQDPTDTQNFITIPAGTVHMDGQTAAWYCRARQATSDFDRTRRQQEVLQAIFARLMSMDALQRAPDFYRTYRASVVTNLTFENVAQWLPLAARLGTNPPIRHFLIGSQHSTEYTVPTDGSKVLLPKQKEILTVMQQVLAP